MSSLSEDVFGLSRRAIHLPMLVQISLLVIRLFLAAVSEADRMERFRGHAIREHPTADGLDAPESASESERAISSACGYLVPQDV
jgi:hypothetical protein